MNALALTGLITILAAVSAAAVAGYLAGYNDRALREEGYTNDELCE